MSAKISIHNLGPIKESTITINNAMVFTGAQASGKSTIGKVIYFFMSVRNDFVAQFSVLPSLDYHDSSTTSAMNKRLRSKFLGLFGSSWAMEEDMKITCEYKEGINLTVFLQSDSKGSGKNYVEFSYSKQLQEIMKSWDVERTTRMEADSHDVLMSKFSLIFDIDFETIYVPAGRGMITLLTDQLSYIFATTEAQTMRSIDYCTKDYVAIILKLRSYFSQGIEGAINDKKHLTQEIIDFKLIEAVKNKIDDILLGKYYYQSGEERLYLNDKKYVKINYASSGQQEVVWVLNIVFYYILERKKVFMILEEPEAHLYPDAQKKIAELLAMFLNVGNKVLLTTHSPYVLGQINNMLMANKIPHDVVKSVMNELYIIRKEELSAYFVHNNSVSDAFDEDLIDNVLIDGASRDINEQTEKLIELVWESDNND